MRCALCGDEIFYSNLYCGGCVDVTRRWWKWAIEQHRTTSRWPKLTISFSTDSALIELDRSGGHPDPNKFNPEPPRQLGSGEAVHIVVEDRGLAHSGNDEIAFFCRLKATPGCTSKKDIIKSDTHLYLEPNSEAAKLFVHHMMSKHRALNPGDTDPPELVERMRKLLPRGSHG